MPSFDMGNLLFLTNQWDSVEESLFCPAVNADIELEKTWQRTKDDIKNVWKELPVTNIFQISLKQVHYRKKTKYADEYDKFRKKFNATIKENIRKLDTFDIRPILRIYVRTKMEAHARLRFHDKPEKGLLAITSKIEQQIYNFERDKIKEQARNYSRERTQTFEPGTPALPGDDIRRLTVMFEEVQKMVTCDDFDDFLRKELSEKIPNYIKDLEDSKQDLLRNECAIIVTGETSAGKTTLINTLIGFHGLFRASIHASTVAITRIRHSDTIRLVVSTKNDILKEEGPFQDLRTLQTAMNKLSDLSNTTEISYIDVHLPISILKGKTIIVDTPGFGDDEKCENVLLDFLPNAVAFVFVINPRNAGGFQKDRIGKILKIVKDNKQNMRCFDAMDDALFLTNQWDCVEDAVFDTANMEMEVEEVWKRIQKDITNNWKGLPLTNIFRISLKQVHMGQDTAYTNEYKIFESKLSETINRNQNKRVQFYFEFIKDFFGKAAVEILAVLEFMKLREMWKEENNQMRADLNKAIEMLEKDNIERQKVLDRCKNGTVDKLSRALEKYLHSPGGKAEILNIPRLKKDSHLNVLTEVVSKIEEGITTWATNKEAKEILEEAEKEIKDVTQAIGSQLNVIAGGLVSTRTSGIPSISVPTWMFGAVLASQLSVVISAVLGSVIGPIIALCGTFFLLI